MADPALAQVRDTPAFEVRLDGARLEPETALDVLDVEVCDYVEGPHTFAVTLNNWDSDRQELKWFDDDLFRPGASVEIRGGYADRLERLVDGEITALEPDFPEAEAPILRLWGYDRLHRFRRGRRTRSFTRMKDSEIAGQVARELGLTADVEDSGVIHEYVLQNNRSDIDFLLERARRIRYELIIRDGTLFFRKAANDRADVRSLLYGQTLRSFRPRLSTLGQVSELALRGWDPKTKEAIEATATTGDAAPRMGSSELGAVTAENAFFAARSAIVETPVFSSGEARQIAEARFNDMAMRFLTGEALAVGDTAVRAGVVVELTGLGSLFSGDYYVVASEHRIDPETGYTTRFSVERNAT
ncbi:MAG: hypothetical protein PVG07_05225 [Acidobacteriota bacterium]|jgi:phage protein D